METSDADRFLVDRIRQGDQDAWRQLIDRFGGRLLAFARGRAPSLADAEDLVQDTFVGFLQSLAHYDNIRSLETYLFTIIRHKLRDLFRSRKTAALGGAADAEDWLEQAVADDAESPSSAAETAEARQLQETVLADVLRKLIHELRDRSAFDDLQVIELIFYAGRRNLEVAEVCGIDQKAVAGIKFRALQRLQKFLAEQETSARAALDETHAEVTVARVWREQRLTCLKRGTLGAYLLGVLEEPWLSYTQFHLDVVACPLCLANLADLEAEEDQSGARPNTQALFESSVGFLSRASHAS
ncbi:MAG TPA: sigma-70 family RNA polymerase sigma factor [Phycisphaerae bacterium]